MRRALGLVCLLALAGAPCWSGRARAQEAEPAEDAIPGVEGEESPELRALRLAELEIFGRDQAIVEITPQMPRPVRLSVPDALTSDAPMARTESGATGRARDLSWLEGLTLPDIPVRWDERVIRYLEFFRDDARGQQLIRSWMRRLDRFGPTIRQTLREQGLPEDLIYVAMIESGFDPRARSGAGAVGLWQFVSRTGAEYGLTQDHWVDMRMDPAASTGAGARYLGALQRRFGTWELAFAAYNMGYGALLRSIRKYDTNDYWELSHLEAALPFETSLYVAKVMACAIVGRNPERFGVGDIVREDPIAIDVVEVPGGTSLGPIARAAGTTVEELHRLNPALRRDRCPPGSERVPVRIPGGARTAFERAWARIRPSDPVERSHVVRFGEDLAAIARRHGVTERELREMNELAEEDRVGVGLAIVVPATTVRASERASDPPVIAIPPGTFEYADRRRVFYRVQRSDELREIARFFGVTLDEVRQWNAIDPRAALQEGMFLQLFVPTRIDLGRAIVMSAEEVRTIVIGSEEFYEHHVRQDGRVRLRYRVRTGDTLSEIAERFGLSTGSMARINQIAREATLRVGQELVVYCEPARVPAELRDQISSEPVVAQAETEVEGEEAETEEPEAEEAEEPEADIEASAEADPAG
ncbi:LysM peptidoglycan-binding domain-containing protein [Sandaracinus amylolyticus]|uniref:LysM peptidoglycan-binding domain-containing protein n=1 Tax=Sandaracinus amylolyticus TaxID=927083 RepID=UPI001F277088|nr:LysM peptidoglycan-binding domain-containing protein [Sandaracinus amylolyticus]UJR81036.1 Membrane-bound lytic murein transglycosylase D [Sandaracinus amylolyticus]